MYVDLVNTEENGVLIILKNKYDENMRIVIDNK